MSVVVFGLVVMEINVSSLYAGCQGARCVGPSLEVQQAEGGESPASRGEAPPSGGGAPCWGRGLLVGEVVQDSRYLCVQADHVRLS